MIDIELAKRLYLEDGKSLRSVAKELNINKSWLAELLRRDGVTIRPFNDLTYYASRRKYLVGSDPRRDYVKIAEMELGRPLDSDEVVHHIDFDRSNNDPTNLFVFPNESWHGGYHGYLKCNDYISPLEWCDRYGDEYNIILSYDFLYQKYIVEGKSANQISKCSVVISRQVITKHLKKLGIWDMRPPTINQYERMP